jgi:hypothetical protein
MYNEIYGKKRKLLFLLSILLIVTLVISTLSVISAADITISPSTPGGLKQAVETAKNGDTIYLKDGVYTVNGKPIQIGTDYFNFNPKKVIIVGLGSKVVIDCKKNIFFEVGLDDYRFKLIHGYNSSIPEKSSLTLQNIKIVNAGSTGYEKGEPAIQSWGTLVLKKCTSINNIDLVSNLNGTTIVNNCYFDGNYKVIRGTTCFISNSKFINGKFDGRDGRAGGIGIQMSSGTVTNCIFKNNSGTSIGIYANQNLDPVSVVIDRCNFTNNPSNFSYSGLKQFQWCVAHTTGTLNVSNSIFSENNQKSIVAYTYHETLTSTLNVNRCTFTKNKLACIDAATRSVSKITNSKFIKNTIYYNNMAPVTNIGRMSVSNCKFTDNICIMGSGSGGIYNRVFNKEIFLDSGILKITKTQFKNNIRIAQYQNNIKRYIAINNDKAFKGKVTLKNVKITPKDGTKVKK